MYIQGGILSSLTELAENLSCSRLEDEWLEALQAQPDVRDMSGALEALLHSGSEDSSGLAHSLLALTLEELEASENHVLGAFLKQAATLFDSSDRLRALLLDHLRDEYLSYEPLERMIELSGLSRGGSIRRGWNALRQLLRYHRGAFVLHERFGPGEIIRIRRTSATVDFQKASDHDMALEALLETTEPLPENSLMVLRWKRPRELAELVGERPGRLLERLLEEHGGEVDENRITPLLEGLDIKPRTLWKRLRRHAAGRRDMMDLGDSIGRISPDDLLHTARRALMESDEPLAGRVTRLEAILSSDREGSLAGPRAARLAAEAAGLETPETGARWEAVWLLSRASGGEVELPPVERTAARAVRALEEISGGDCAREYIRGLAGVLPGSEVVNLLRQLGSRRRELLLQALLSARENMAVSALSRLATDMGEPDTYIWSVSQALSRGLSEEAGLEADEGLAADLLEAMGYAGASGQRKACRLLDGDLQGPLDRYLAGLDTRRLSALTQKLEGSTAAHETGLLLKVRRELSNRRRSSASSSRRFWEGEAIFSSTEAIARRRAEADRLEKRDIPAAAEAVGEAAAHGDLSENAEYEAAVERRDMLLAKLRDYKEQLRRARPYPVSDVSSRVCSPGTAVTLAGPDGDRLTYSLVGPLDALPEEGRINYLSPLGATLLGRRAGDEVSLPGGEEVFVESIEVLPEVRAR